MVMDSFAVMVRNKIRVGIPKLGFTLYLSYVV